MAENLAVKVGKLEARMEGVESAVANFRNLDRNVTEFMTEFRTHRDDEERTLETAAKQVAVTLAEHNRKTSLKVNIVIAVCAVLALILGVPAAIFSYKEINREIHSNELTMPKIFSSAPVNASNHQPAQDSNLPPTYAK
jgi:hypothetical protein